MRIPDDIEIYFMWGFAILLGVILAIYVLALIRSLFALRWKQVPGELINLGMQASDGDSNSGPTYTPIVEYKYKIKHTTYTSEKIGYGLWGTSSAWLSERTLASVSTHPLPVFYNPVHPGESVLIRGATFHHLVCLILISATFGISWYMILRSG